MTTRLAPRLFASLATILPLLAGGTAAAAEVADLILVDATVVTMDPVVPRAQAVAIKDGRILAVGDIEHVLAMKGDATRIRDLDGQVVVPGFVDCRGSCLAAGLAACSVDLTGLPAGEDFMQTLAARAKDPVARRVGLVLGAAADPLPGITRERLDEAVRDMPAMVMSKSGHVVVLNSKACELAGVDAKGDGVLEGLDARRAARDIVAARPVESLAAILRAGQELLASRGYTTVAEANVADGTHAAFVRLAAARRMVLDVVAFADGNAPASPACLSGPWTSASPTNGYRVGGIAVAFDHELADALDSKPAAADAGIIEPARRREVLAGAYERGWQVMAEAHGHDAIGQFVETILEVAASKGPVDRRPVLVGADMAGPEHFTALAEPGVGIAFGPGRITLDGDRLREAMTDTDDAERLAPAATALSQRIPVAFHSTDGLADPLRVIEGAAGRRTLSGDILGPRERVSVEQALAGVTIGGARLLGEQSGKGSIEVGKQADLVILSGDPIKAGPAGLPRLRVIETIKSGRTIHDQSGPNRPVHRVPGAAWVTTP